MPVLDAMRGLAALFVVMLHYDSTARLATVAWPWGRIWLFGQGWIAVDFFFLLSGFVLSRSYGEALAGGAGAGRFLRRRWVRLWPAFAASCTLGLAALLVQWQRGAIHPSAAAVALAAAANFAILPNPAALDRPQVPAGTTTLYPLNPVGWSLTCEIVANLAFCWLVRWRSRRLLVLVLVLLAVLGWQAHAAYAELGKGRGLLFDIKPHPGAGLLLPLPRVMFSFCAGMLLHRFRPRRESPALAGLAVLAALVAGMAMVMGSAGMQSLLMLVLIGPAAVWWGSAVTVLPRRPAWLAEWLGRLSYPVYCVHLPVKWLANLATGPAPGPGPMLARIALTIALAILVERAIDARARRSARRHRLAV